MTRAGGLLAHPLLIAARDVERLMHLSPCSRSVEGRGDHPADAIKDAATIGKRRVLLGNRPDEIIESNK